MRIYNHKSHPAQNKTTTKYSQNSISKLITLEYALNYKISKNEQKLYQED